MYTKKNLNHVLFAGVTILSERIKNRLKSRFLRIKKAIIRLHPWHWFDGLLDGIKIDLDEFE
jgi:hypothetical protein